MKKLRTAAILFVMLASKAAFGATQQDADWAKLTALTANDIADASYGQGTNAITYVASDWTNLAADIENDATLTAAEKAELLDHCLFQVACLELLLALVLVHQCVHGIRDHFGGEGHDAS